MKRMHDVDIEKSTTKFSDLLNKIQFKALNNQTLKKELQQGINNISNLYATFNKVVGNKGAGTANICEICRNNSNNLEIHHTKKGT